MKRIILILICLLSNNSWAQDTLGLKGVNEEIIITVYSSLRDSIPKPTYVLIFGNKQLLLNSDFNTTKHGKKIVKYLYPKSIKRINTIRGIAAINKYGTFGNKGVVEIWIKRKNFKDLPPEIIEEFKSIKD